MDQKGGSLPDCIAELFPIGRIHRQFRVSDLRPHLGHQFAENYIRTALANYAEDTDNYVKRWSAPRFRRVGRGLYEISN
jgi:hypothetical protein